MRLWTWCLRMAVSGECVPDVSRSITAIASITRWLILSVGD